MTSKRIFAALLASLLLLPALVSCSDNAQDTPGTSAPADTTTADTTTRETERHEIKDSLPDNLKFDGKTFNIYVSTQAVHDTYVMGTEEKAGDIVNEAVMDRNTKVQERLDFKLEAKPHADTWKDTAANISTLLLAGDASFDVYLGIQYGMTSLAAQRMFTNAYDVKHLDFDQPWWMNNFMNEVALGDNYRFLLVSDFNTQAIAYIRNLFFNKVLYEKLYGDPNELYKEVLDGKWTLDRLNTIVAGAYVDLNSDGLSDLKDQLGFIANQLNATTDCFVYGSGVEFTTRDKDGFIQLNMLSDEAVKLLEDLNKFFHQNAVNVGSGGKEAAIFMEGNSLVLGNSMLSTSTSLRDMEDDYGFLPSPKIYEDQEEYYGLVHDTALLTGISSLAKDLDMVGAVLEALSAESYRIVTPAWYESALKLKYARDDISSQVIDLMRESMSTNFIFAYNGSLNGIGQVYRGLITKNSSDYVSTVQSKLPAAEQKLAELVAVYKGQ